MINLLNRNRECEKMIFTCIVKKLGIIINEQKSFKYQQLKTSAKLPHEQYFLKQNLNQFEKWS